MSMFIVGKKTLMDVNTAIKKYEEKINKELKELHDLKNFKYFSDEKKEEIKNRINQLKKQLKEIIPIQELHKLNVDIFNKKYGEKAKYYKIISEGIQINLLQIYKSLSCYEYQISENIYPEREKQAIEFIQKLKDMIAHEYINQQIDKKENLYWGD